VLQIQMCCSHAANRQVLRWWHPMVDIGSYDTRDNRIRLQHRSEQTALATARHSKTKVFWTEQICVAWRMSVACEKVLFTSR